MRVDDRAARDRGARAELDAARPPRARAGHVGRPGDVDDEGDVRLEREGGGAGAAAADLLLHRRDRDDVDPGGAALGEPAGRLERRVGTEPVVERTRDEPPVRQLERRPVPDAGVARRDERVGVLAARRADVDVQVVGGGAHPPASVRAPSAPRGTITPSTGPPRPAIVTRWPASISPSMPPSVLKASRPLPSTWVTVTPISSIWPTSASVRPPPEPTRAYEVPSVSPLTSAKAAAASRQTRSPAPRARTGRRRSGARGAGRESARLAD